MIDLSLYIPHIVILLTIIFIVGLLKGFKNGWFDALLQGSIFCGIAVVTGILIITVYSGGELLLKEYTEARDIKAGKIKYVDTESMLHTNAYCAWIKATGNTNLTFQEWDTLRVTRTLPYIRPSHIEIQGGPGRRRQVEVED